MPLACIFHSMALHDSVFRFEGASPQVFLIAKRGGIPRLLNHWLPISLRWVHDNSDRMFKRDFGCRPWKIFPPTAVTVKIHGAQTLRTCYENGVSLSLSYPSRRVCILLSIDVLCCPTSRDECLATPRQTSGSLKFMGSILLHVSIPIFLVGKQGPHTYYR